MPVEVRARESLLTPSQQEEQRRKRSASQASQMSTKTTNSVSTTATTGTTATAETRTLADVEARYREESEMVRAAQEAVMHRPNFAIDAIGDSDGEEDETPEDDAGVMDEVEAFLKAHGGEDDTGLKGEERKQAEGESTRERSERSEHSCARVAPSFSGMRRETDMTDLLKAEPMKGQ